MCVYMCVCVCVCVCVYINERSVRKNRLFYRTNTLSLISPC